MRRASGRRPGAAGVSSIVDRPALGRRPGTRPCSQATSRRGSSATPRSLSVSSAKLDAARGRRRRAGDGERRRARRLDARHLVAEGRGDHPAWRPPGRGTSAAAAISLRSPWRTDDAAATSRRPRAGRRAEWGPGRSAAHAATSRPAASGGERGSRTADRAPGPSGLELLHHREQRLVVRVLRRAPRARSSAPRRAGRASRAPRPGARRSPGSGARHRRPAAASAPRRACPSRYWTQPRLSRMNGSSGESLRAPSR